MRTASYLVEAKQTAAGQYILKGETWKKIRDEAVRSNRIPLMVISMDGLPRSLVVMGMDDFQAMSGEDL